MKNLENRVRNYEGSKSERIIAEYLEAIGLEFKYEDRFCLKNERGKAALFYPDFHLIKYGIVIEYLGMMNHKEKGKEYALNAEAKRRLYEEQGITVLQIRPEELWEKGFKRINKNFGKYLISRINEKIETRGEKPIEFGHIDSYLSPSYLRRAA